MEGKPQIRRAFASREAEVARIASGQHGVITRSQLIGLGISGKAIDARIRRFLLHPLHRGVYLVGHRAATWRALELAVVLACGAGAVLSHVSTARFWKLLPYPAQPVPFHITVPGQPRASREWIQVHSVDLQRREWMIRDGIRVTSPPRTLLDLAAQVGSADLAHAVNEAHAQRLVTPLALLHLIADNGGRPGIRALRGVCADEPRMTRSEAERSFLSLLRDAELPLPETNVRVAGHEVDFLWREQGLIVETDGWAAHSSRTAFERDRRRDAELAALGFQVIRITWRQLATEPAAAVDRVAQTLRARPRRTGDSASR